MLGYVIREEMQAVLWRHLYGGWSIVLGGFAVGDDDR